jgi:hypothetical protein
MTLRVFVTLSVVALFGREVRAAPKRNGCDVQIDTRKGTIRILGQSLADFKRGTLLRVLGKPSRVERRAQRRRFERFPGRRGGRPVSNITTVRNSYYLYDRCGFVFSTDHTSHFDKRVDPKVLYVVFHHKTSFAHRKRPRVMPKGLFRARLTINGERLHPNKPLFTKKIPTKGTLTLFGRPFSKTSFGADVDSLYDFKGKPTLWLFLDGAEKRRPAYLLLR